MGAIPRRLQLRQHLLLEAAEAGVEPVQRQLAAVEREVVRQHLEVDGRILVTGEADVAHLALRARLLERLDDAAAREVALGLVVVDALVNLPQVEVVGLAAASAIPRAAASQCGASRPWVQTFVIRKTRSR